MWLAGYAARTKPAEGKVQELYAKALALEDQRGERLVIVTTDLIGISQSLRQAVEDHVAEQFRLGKHSLLLNASHTHSGPQYRLISPQSLQKVGFNSTPESVASLREQEAREYSVKLEQKLVEVIGGALADLSEVRLSWGHARCGFAMNRRLQVGDQVRNSPNSEGPVDHELPALRVEAINGTLRGVLFGYACHNTSLNGYDISGDYAGYAQEYLQANRPNFVAMFLMGCGGDQNPYPRHSRDPGIAPGVTDIDLAKSHGRSLANAVEMALVVRPRPLHGPLRVAYSVIPLEYTDGRPTHNYPLQLVRFGDDLTLIALGGEVLVDYSLRLKRELAGKAAVWVAGYSNDMPGYIPSARVIREGGYETSAGWAESIEERIVRHVHNMYHNLMNEKTSAQ